jgi:hypothetical protein
MKASKLFFAIIAATLGGSVFAADVPAANVSATSAAAAAQVTVAAQSLNVPAVLVAKNAGRSREEVKAEAIEAVKHHRATEASQYDWITN